jgi:hypothetical protein
MVNILIKEKTQICLKKNKSCGKKTTAYSQNTLHGDTLYNINRRNYKTVCADADYG